jgi:nickel superoxide dismutase
MFYQILDWIDQRFPLTRAKAHCDIPCGIYDPIIAQIAALTVVRMIDLMKDLEGREAVSKLDYHNSMSRYIAIKEEHAEKAKQEVRIIWGDYFKDHHLEKYPHLHQLVHQIMALGSKVRQSADRQVGEQFVEAINQFAQIFWETKGIATRRAKAPYAPNLELIYPVIE